MPGITVAKAVEILDLNLREAGKKMPPDVRAALRLAVAALQRLQSDRQLHGGPLRVLLPGEDPDTPPPKRTNGQDHEGEPPA